MTIADASLIRSLEAEIDSLRSQLVALVDRIDAAVDLKLRAEYHRDRSGRQPSVEDLLRVADEIEAASIRALARRITGDPQS